MKVCRISAITKEGTIMSDDQSYLLRIKECIARIDQYIVPGKKEFMDSTLRQDAVLRNLQVIAESTQHLSENLKNQHIEVHWREMTELQQCLVADFNLNLEQIWNLVDINLSQYKQQISRILQNLS